MTAFDTIADPVRLAIVRHLAQHGRAVLADLAGAAGVHANTIRSHVAAMEKAGLLAREQRPSSGRGRRPVEYRLVEGWALSPGGFLGLAELLATVALRHRPPARDLRRMGRRWDAYRRGRPGVGDPLGRVPGVLEHLGFQAQVEEDTVVLTGCPCPLVAPGDPALVCGLVVGAVEGVGEEEGLRVVGRAHDPANRRCRLKVAIPEGSTASEQA
jgi:predicted ArsR family transcriptional regulator